AASISCASRWARCSWTLPASILGILSAPPRVLRRPTPIYPRVRGAEGACVSLTQLRDTLSLSSVRASCRRLPDATAELPRSAPMSPGIEEARRRGGGLLGPDRGPPRRGRPGPGIRRGQRVRQPAARRLGLHEGP